MQISDIPAALLLCREAQIASFLWGHRGLGKSDSHKDLALANDWGFIDLRGSQLEASDVRGLPKAVDNMTKYLPPSELPQGHDPNSDCPACSAMTREEAKDAGIRDNQYCKGILFLDEINRSEDDVLQAVFQLVLDRKVGEYELPDGWSVHCAGNYAEGYNTNNFQDPAFLDRFCHLQVSTGQKYTESWIDWMTSTHPGMDKIIQYISSNDENLIGQVVQANLGFSIQPSPRSWAMVARVLEACDRETFPEKAREEVIAGLIGSSHAPAFERFSCDVTPAMIVNDGVTAHEGKLNDLSRNAIFGLSHGIGSKCVGTTTEALGPDRMKNVADYLLWLTHNSKNRDMAVTLARRLVGQESSIQGAMLSNPKIANIALRYQKKRKKVKKSSADGWIATIHKYDELREMMQKVTWDGTGGN